MTSTFQLYQAGTLVVDLMVYPYYVTEMSFNSPDVRTRDEALSYEHGLRTTLARYNNVNEELSLIVAGTTQEEVSSNLSSLERTLNEAITYRNSYGDQILIKVQVNGASTAYRSEVIRANVLEAENRLSQSGDVLLASGYVGKKFTHCKLTLTRNYYWETWDLVNIPLTNSYATDNTTGLQVYSHDDSGTNHDNWALVKAQHVVGSLPAPLRLIMKNTGGNVSDRMYTLWMGHNAYYSPGSFQHQYEAESGTKGSGVTQISGDYSNGLGVTTLHSDSTEHKDLYWDLSAAQLGYARGRWFKILINVLTNNSTSCKVKMATSYQGVTLQETGWSLLNTNGVFDAGTLRIPPTNIGGVVAPQAISLELWTVTAGSTYDIDLDWIMLIPAEEPDGVVKFTPVGYGLVQNTKLIQDGPENNHYIASDDEVSGGLSLHNKLGKYLQVVPNKDQRLYFTWTATDPGGGPERCAAHTHAATVVCKYRPRRLKV